MGPSGGVPSDTRAQLGAADRLLGAIIETVDDAVFTCDAAGRIVSWPAIAQRLFGLRDADALGCDLYSVFPEHLRSEVRSLTARVLAGEHITHVEGEVVRTDGLPVPVWLSLCPVEDERGGVLGALIVARDVTEQHLAQARLAEVEVRLAESEAIAHVGSWLWDLRTEVVQWSSEFHRIHGMDPHDFGGTLEAHLAVVHPDDRAVVRATMERSIVARRQFEEEHRIVRPDGKVRVVRIWGQPSIGSAGGAVGLRGSGAT